MTGDAQELDGGPWNPEPTGVWMGTGLRARYC